MSYLCAVGCSCCLSTASSSSCFWKSPASSGLSLFCRAAWLMAARILRSSSWIWARLSWGLGFSLALALPAAFAGRLCGGGDAEGDGDRDGDLRRRFFCCACLAEAALFAPVTLVAGGAKGRNAGT